MSSVISQLPSAAAPRAESILAEVLAGVLRVERVPVDSDFFEELGADSLVMAQFCARVRKRGDLPPVSMKDVYAHPTIRSLAEALADVAPASGTPPAATVMELPTPTNTREYVLCGALQALFYLGYSYLGVLAAIAGYQWMVAGSQVSRVTCGWSYSAAWLSSSCPPFRSREVADHRSLEAPEHPYLEPRLCALLDREDPDPVEPGRPLFVGSPLYVLYLRALGAKVGPRAVILSRHIPVCTDLLTIGAETVIRRESIFLCYRAQAGRIEIGPVTLGRDVFVGETTVLDINTSMGDGAQLVTPPRCTAARRYRTASGGTDLRHSARR